MNACEGSVMGGDVSALVRAPPPLLGSLIEQLVREQLACLQPSVLLVVVHRHQ
jgi:hypothetical protein